MRRRGISLLLMFWSACSFRAGELASSSNDDASVPDDSSDAFVDPDAPDAQLRTDWWDAAYPVRFPILITSSIALPMGYQVAVVTDLDMAPCMAAGPYTSVRIAPASAMSELPRVIEAASAVNDRIWFALPAAHAAGTSAPSGYFVYCGASSPTAAPSDPSLVFDYYDGFDGTALTSGWMTAGATTAPTVGGGEVTIPAGRSIYRSLPFGPGHILEYSTHKTATNGQYWGGWQNGTSYAAPWMVWIARQPNAVRPELFGIGDSGYTLGTDISIDSASHVYSIEYQSDRAYYRTDGGTESSLAFDQDLTQQMGIRFENYDSNAAMQVQSVRVRRAVRPAPTAALGAMETY